MGVEVDDRERALCSPVCVNDWREVRGAVTSEEQDSIGQREVLVGASYRHEQVVPSYDAGLLGE